MSLSGLQAPPAHLAALNDPQRQAVETLDGPVLVLAGAGTGKTRVLTTRLGHLLMTRRAWPSQILAVTFTNKAAREMRERLEALIGPATEGLWLGTFHALAARLLRRHAEAVGLRPDFTILDPDDQLRVLKQLIAVEGVDDKRWPPRMLLSTIERWKDRGLVPDQVDPLEAKEVANGKSLVLYRAYQDRLRTLNAADFGDLLLHNLTIFAARPDILGEYQTKFRYILVDEYQDTNIAQYQWLRRLAEVQRNICCVGDDDQSIYAWRGAEVGNILRFEQDFPGAVVIRLEQNYRSTPEILAAAGHLIAHNHGRLGKTLWTAHGSGERVLVRGHWDAEAEARAVADDIEAEQRRGTSLAAMAVLVRAGFQTREFEERFIALGIPYRVVGGPRFYERQEIRDALAYLRLVNQNADDLAFERIVNLPRRGIGEATLQILHRIARDRGRPLMETARLVLETDELKPAARRALGSFVRDIDRWQAEVGKIAHTDLARIILDESGYTGMWQADPSPEAPGRLENLKELVVAMAEFETLVGFLEHVSLVMENATETGRDQVTVMTLHAAKGLEFEVVFLPGWEEGLFPHQRALDEGAAGLEEERRLAYVGLTRAKRRAIVSTAANRRIHGQWQSALPSRFIGELPQDQIEVEAPRGLGGQAAQVQMASSFFDFDTPPPRLARRSAQVESPNYRRQSSGDFSLGDRIRHGKFGEGIVIAIEADKLTINFDTAGEKRVMDSFVERL